MFKKKNKNAERYEKECLVYLYERVEALEEMCKIDHIYICPNYSTYIKELKDSLYSKEAREWARKNGYSYVKTLATRGELWVKEEKNNV